MECEYCKYNGESLYNDRQWSRNNDANAMTGVEVDIFDNEMYVIAVLDAKGIYPLVGEASFPIRFCPMCGRDFRENEWDD